MNRLIWFTGNTKSYGALLGLFHSFFKLKSSIHRDDRIVIFGWTTPRSISIHFLHLCLISVAISSHLLPQKHFAHDHNVWLILRNCKYYSASITWHAPAVLPLHLLWQEEEPHVREPGLRGKLLNIMTEHLKGFEWHERGADPSFCKHRFSRGLDLWRD